MQNILCSFIVVIITITSTLPSGHARRMVYVGGFYGNPLRADSLIPQEAVSTFVSGDTIATNSHIDIFGASEYDEEEKDVDSVAIDSIDKTQELESQPNQTANPNEEQITVETNSKDEAETTTIKPNVVMKINKKKNRTPVVINDDSDWPFQLGRNGAPSYNTFFPITLGAGERSKFKSSGGEDFYPGAATAIANSFSTGKGGVASSQATSYGDPNIAAFLRSNFNPKTAKHQ